MKDTIDYLAYRAAVQVLRVASKRLLSEQNDTEFPRAISDYNEAAKEARRLRALVGGWRGLWFRLSGQVRR